MSDFKCECGETNEDKFYKNRSKSQCKKCRRVAENNKRRIDAKNNEALIIRSKAVFDSFLLGIKA